MVGEGKRILVFAGDVSVERRLTGQPNVDLVLCYDRHGEEEGSGIKRLDDAVTELLSMKELAWDCIVFDPFNFFYDDQFLKFSNINRGNGLAAYGDLRNYGQKFLKRITGLKCYVIIICHSKYGVIDSRKEEQTNRRGEKQIVTVPVGEAVHHPAVDGSIKNTFEGRFDAVFHTLIKQGPMNTAKYLLRGVPTSEFHAGAKLPIGLEHLVKGEMEPDLGKFILKVRSEFDKLKGGK